MKVQVFIFSVLWWFGGLLSAQNVSECQSFLEQYIEKNIQYTMPKGDESYYLKFETILYEVPNSLGEVKQGVAEMLLSAKGFMYKSASVNIYQDSKNSFIVIDLLKKIIWRTTDQNQNKGADFFKYAGAQKDLMKRGKMESCSDVVIDGKNCRKAVFVLDEAYQSIYNADKIDFYYDVTSKKMVQQTVYHHVKKTSAKTTMKYLKMDYHSKKKVGEARSYIFSSGNQLKENYKGYEILDKRKN